jgi:hypothetical protein
MPPFPQAGHQEIHHQPDQGIGQQGPTRPGRGYRGTGCQKQAGADGAANGDHGQMTRLQAAPESFAFSIVLHKSVLLQSLQLMTFCPESNISKT